MIFRDGSAAIRRIPPRGKLITVRGTEYLFRIQHDISLCWVKEKDVGAILAIREGCCGGIRRQVYHPADETHVRRWESGGR